MNALSSIATRHYAPGSSRGRPNLTTLAQQMALIARGERLEELRNAKGLTQDEIPWALKEFNDGEHVVSRRAWQAWVAGGKMKPKNARVVAEFFGVDPGEISDPELAMHQNGNGPDEPTLADVVDRLDAIATQLDAAEAERADVQRRLGVIEELLRRRPSGGS